MKSSNLNGVHSELYVSQELTKRGFIVSIPVADEGYDIVIDNGNSLYRVQVKSCYKSSREEASNEYRCPFTRNNPVTGERKNYSSDEVSAYAVHNKELDEIYWVWFEEAPSSNTRRSLSTWRESKLDKVDI